MIDTATPVRFAQDDLYRTLATGDNDDAVSVILKLRGETCNIDCLYCYEKRKESPGGATIDAEDVARLGDIFGTRPLAVELHGGEPLTTPRDRMAEILDRLAEMPTVVAVTLQTNGTLLDDEWLDLFDEHLPSIQFTVSLDGDPEGNAWRVTYNGEPTHDRVERAIGLLARRGRKVGITTVVTSRVLGRCAQAMDYLAGFDNVRAVNLIPCFDMAAQRATASTTTRATPSRQLQQAAVAGEHSPGWATTPDEFADFVLEAAGLWIQGGLWRRFQLSPIVAIIRRLRGLDVRNCHFNARKCDHVFTAYPDGRLGSCDELPWPQAQLLAAGSRPTMPLAVATQAASPLLSRGRNLMSKCTTCDYGQTCGGGCISHRLRHITTQGEDDSYCRHRMRLIDGVASLLAAPGHQPATACRAVRWSPRHPNTMRDVESFLTRWAKPHAERAPAVLRRSRAGNINTLGTDEVCEADDLDPLHPQWREGIESGVWPLVEAITDAGFVTYDSCEGHPDGIRELAVGGARVGVLPRDHDDASRISVILCGVLTRILEGLPAGTSARACRGYLRCQRSGRSYPVVDLRLEPASPELIDAFYANRDASIRLAAQAFTATAATRPRRCECGTPAPGRTT